MKGKTSNRTKYSVMRKPRVNGSIVAWQEDGECAKPKSLIAKREVIRERMRRGVPTEDGEKEKPDRLLDFQGGGFVVRRRWGC
mmetsp:Transcript_25557/g.38594  ORF Transcript_25557/g.38594 Transcript_25557/m.38594 type:complete len:83 (+) Transcript_25557:339-587(+)